MPQYLLDCTCGERLAVGDQQAGGQVTCRCGNVLAVPTLRKLRDLPTQAAETTTPASATWGPRRQVLALGLVLAAVLLGAATWAWVTIPHIPQWADVASDFAASRQQAVDNLTPTTGFMLFEREYKPLARQGFAEVQLIDPTGAEQVAGEKKWLAATLGIAAAVVAVLAAIVASVLPR